MTPLRHGRPGRLTHVRNLSRVAISRVAFLPAAAVAVLLFVTAAFAPRAVAAPALITYGGNVVLGPFVTTEIELAGTTRGTGYDAFNIAGQLTFAGTLRVVLIDSFTPAAGDSFNLYDWGSATGTFGALQLPALPASLIWDTSQLYLTGTLRVATPLTPIEQWRVLHFGSPANAGAGANLTDFEADGLPNLLEYALGLDPRLATPPALQPARGETTVSAARYQTLTFTRPLAATDVHYRVEVSTDLVTWLPGSRYSAALGDVPVTAATTEVSRTLAPDGLTETIVVRDLTATTALRRFIRLSITHP